MQIAFVVGGLLYYTSDMSSIASFVTSSLTTLTALTVIALGSLYCFQDALLYFPQTPAGARTEVMAPAAFDLVGEEHLLEAPDGTPLHSFYIPAAAGADTAPTVLFFHGNAGNIGHRLPNAYHLHRLGLNVMLAEFRGYGRSGGRPSQAAIEADTHVYLDWLLRQRDRLDTSKIIVFGRSLGGAAAIALAAARQDELYALVLENTFTSVSDMIDVLMPIFAPFKALCTNKWLSHERIPSLSLPILFLSGLQDELVPSHHMATLHSLAANPDRVTFVPFPNGTHNETWLEPGYFDALSKWIFTDLPALLA